MALTGIEHEVHTPVAQPRRHGNEVVGLPGFEPGSIAPKATSIDQTNPQAPKINAAVESS